MLSVCYTIFLCPIKFYRTWLIHVQWVFKRLAIRNGHGTICFWKEINLTKPCHALFRWVARENVNSRVVFRRSSVYYCGYWVIPPVDGYLEEKQLQVASSSRCAFTLGEGKTPFLRRGWHSCRACCIPPLLSPWMRNASSPTHVPLCYHVQLTGHPKYK